MLRHRIRMQNNNLRILKKVFDLSDRQLAKALAKYSLYQGKIK